MNMCVHTIKNLNKKNIPADIGVVNGKKNIALGCTCALEQYKKIITKTLQKYCKKCSLSFNSRGNPSEQDQTKKSKSTLPHALRTVGDGVEHFDFTTYHT